MNPRQLTTTVVLAGMLAAAPMAAGAPTPAQYQYMGGAGWAQIEPPGPWTMDTVLGRFQLIDQAAINAPADRYVAGTLAQARWCSPVAGTNLTLIEGVITAYHTTLYSGTRVMSGAGFDAAGQPIRGTVAADVPGPSGMRVEAINGPCVYVRVQEGTTKTTTNRRLWGLKVNAAIYTDLIGPSVTTPAVTCPGTAGWCNGPIEVSWSSADNLLGRNGTRAEVEGGGSLQPADAYEDGAHKVTGLDPGPDGPRLVRAVAEGAGWNPAVAVTAIQVDRTPPSIPTSFVASTASGPAPITLSASGSTDQRSGVAGYQFTTDAGRTVRRDPVLRDTGAYTVRARAIDQAGNASAWTAPITVAVTQDSPSTAAVPPAILAQGPLPDLSRAQLTSIRGTTRNRVYRGQVVAYVKTKYRRTTTIRGRFGLAVAKNPLRRATVFLLTSATAQAPVGIAQTDRSGRFTLRFRPTRNGLYQLCAVGRPMVCRGVLVRVSPRVLIPRPTERITTGGSLRVSGRVVPGPWARGRVVRLEFRTRTGWVSAGKAGRIDRFGRFRLSYRLLVPLQTRYRVRLDAGPRDALVSGVSAPIGLTVR